MLQKLSGKWHELVTGLIVNTPHSTLERVVTTQLLFREIPEDVIDAYVLTG